MVYARNMFRPTVIPGMAMALPAPGASGMLVNVGAGFGRGFGGLLAMGHGVGMQVGMQMVGGRAFGKGMVHPGEMLLPNVQLQDASMYKMMGGGPMGLSGARGKGMAQGKGQGMGKVMGKGTDNTKGKGVGKGQSIRSNASVAQVSQPSSRGSLYRSADATKLHPQEEVRDRHGHLPQDRKGLLRTGAGTGLQLSRAQHMTEGSEGLKLAAPTQLSQNGHQDESRKRRHDERRHDERRHDERSRSSRSEKKPQTQRGFYPA